MNCFIFLLIHLVTPYQGCCANTVPGMFLVGCDSDRIPIKVGEDLITPCYFYSQYEPQLVSIVWERLGPRRLVQQYLHNTSRHGQQDAAYQNRSQMFENEIAEGNVSLRLNNMSLSDTGTYRLNVSSNSGTGYKDINISVGAMGHSPRFYSFVTKRNHSVLICESVGWYPAPSVTWQTRSGRNITKYSQTHETDSRDGMVRVRSAIEFPTGSNGSYTCSIWNPLFHQGTSSNYTLPSLGLGPFIESRVTGSGRSVLTCQSSGWNPTPEVSWRNDLGHTVAKFLQTELSNGSDGGVSVRSTLKLEAGSNGNYTCIIWNPTLKQGLCHRFTVLTSRYKEIRSHWYAVGAIVSAAIIAVATVIKAKSFIRQIKKERKGHSAYSTAE
ncbi:butyrophilin-like protein 2 [Scyliorhinus canicula]|uniref:butyrophilin-like protein 2 n=1 Tax=Scyliorhinus canicula TaxID=7830 RepID=UPI0018F4EB32|nr:butyrophilin-like protein 2 [Scyliorhinus canicula]